MTASSVGISGGPCFACPSPAGTPAPFQEFGGWVNRSLGSYVGDQPYPAGTQFDVNRPPNWVWFRQNPIPSGLDVQATGAPALTTPAAKVNQPVVAPGSNQPLSVSGGNSSTSNPAIDTNRQIAGQVPGTSVAVKNPA